MYRRTLRGGNPPEIVLAGTVLHLLHVTFIKAWGEVEVRRTRKRPIGARGRHFSRPEGG